MTSASRPEGERRSSPRVPVVHHSVSVIVHTRARIVEIGLGGVLMDCAATFSGTKTKLRVPLAHGRFSSDLQVCYERPRPDDAAGKLVGAAFVELASESRLMLERFLARAAR